MERGQSKAETGKEHLERNDFILEKQKSELRNLDAVRRYKEYQVKVAEERKRTQAEAAKLEAYKKTVAQQMENAVRNAVLKKDDEICNLKDRISWRDKMLGIFTKILMQSNGTFRKAVDIIIGFAKDTYRSIFSREEAKTIKSMMEAFGKDKEDYRAIGTFLVFTADEKESLSNSEYRKVAREVDDVAIGRYEQAQKRGNSLKL